MQSPSEVNLDQGRSSDEERLWRVWGFGASGLRGFGEQEREVDAVAGQQFQNATTE